MTQHQSENVIDFVVMGEPRPWTAQIRHAERSSGFLEMQAWQDLIRIEAKRAMKGREPFAGPIYLQIIFCRGFPKWAPKGPRYRIGWAEKHILTKPDGTNMLKACEDAMTQLVYLDDSQVVKAEIEKEYAHGLVIEGHTQIVVQAPRG